MTRLRWRLHLLPALLLAGLVTGVSPVWGQNPLAELPPELVAQKQTAEAFAHEEAASLMGTVLLSDILLQEFQQLELSLSRTNPNFGALDQARYALLRSLEPPPIPPEGTAQPALGADLAGGIEHLRQLGFNSNNLIEAAEAIPALRLQLRQWLGNVAGVDESLDPTLRVLIGERLWEEAVAGAAFFEAIAPLDFPQDMQQVIPLGTLLEDYHAQAGATFAGWQRLEVAEQAVVRGRLRHLVELIDVEAQIPERSALLQLHQPALDWLQDASNLPTPAGKQNAEYYSSRLVTLITLRAELAATAVRASALTNHPLTSAMIEALGIDLGAATPHYAPIDSALQERVRESVNPRAFREPLQVPHKFGTPDTTWLTNLLKRLMPSKNLPGGRLWGRIVLVLLFGLLLGYLLNLIYTAGNRRRAIHYREGVDSVVSGRGLQVEEQFARALQAAQGGHFIEAWHWLTQGFLVGLAQRKLIYLDWSKTNREYVRELQYAAAGTYSLARGFFRTAEGIVYGSNPTSEAEIRQFHDELLAHLKGLPVK